MTILRLGTLGAAYITPKVLIQPALRNDDAEIVAVAARDRDRAAAFAREFGIPHVHANYDELIHDDRIDAVYVPLPVAHHCEWTLKALSAGKHVLCEKAFCMNSIEAQSMADLAAKQDLVLLEAFHYRYHPVMRRLIEIVSTGQLGTIEHIEGEFSAPADNRSAVYTDRALGGGATMHLGCYPAHWLRHIVSEEPKVVRAQATLGEGGVDLSLFAEVQYASGATGRWGSHMGAPERVMTLSVTGSRGRLIATNPLVPHMGHKIELTVDGKNSVEQLSERPSYDFQLEAFIDAIENGTPQPTDAHDATLQMGMIDAAYIAAGLNPRGL